MTEFYKTCSRCGRKLPADKEHFHVHTVRMTNGDNWRGLRPECKECRHLIKKKYYKKNIEKYQAYQRQYYRENKKND